MTNEKKNTSYAQIAKRFKEKGKEIYAISTGDPKTSFVITVEQARENGMIK